MFECIVSFCYFDFFISFTYELLELMNSDTVESSYLEYSISWALLYLEQIRLFIGHLALDQSKILLVSQIPSNIFSDPLSSFLSLSSIFPELSKLFGIFILKLVFFPLSLVQLLQLCREEGAKTLKSSFFFFFLIECFDSIF